MVEIIKTLLILIPYVLSLPLSLYIGFIFENIKNYKFYNQKLIQKKKNDDIEDKDDVENTTDIKNSENTNKAEGDNNNKEYETKNNICIPKTFNQCFVFEFSYLKHPSKFYNYYSRFSLYFIFFITLLFISKPIVPELLDIFTLNFWIPSKLNIKSSIIGFIVTIIFGQPWLDNPFLQMYTLNKYLHCHNGCNIHVCKTCALKSSRKSNENDDSTKFTKNEVDVISRKQNILLINNKEVIDWNPKLHFNNKRKTLLLDVSRFVCSCVILPIMEELVFRYFLYRFIIGGFNFQLVSFSTWRWTAAIMSNIAITHAFYIRCYEKGEEWITGLINGYICTYSMVKQGRWNASVNTHFLINFFVGLYVLITKKYKYWC